MLNYAVKCPHCNVSTTFQIVEAGITDKLQEKYLIGAILKCQKCDKFVSLIPSDMIGEKEKPPVR